MSNRKPTRHQLILLRILYDTDQRFRSEFWNPDYAQDKRAMLALEANGWLKPREDSYSGWRYFTEAGEAIAKAESDRERRVRYLEMLEEEHPVHSDDSRDRQDCPKCREATGET